MSSINDIPKTVKNNRHTVNNGRPRALVILAAALAALFALCICFVGCGTLPKEHAEPAETKVPFSEGELLPDWEIASKSPDRINFYRGIKTEQLQEYLDGMIEKGFTLLEQSKNENGGKILYRDGVWLEISDNTHTRKHSNGGCGIRVSIHEYSGGMSREAAAQVIGTGGMEKPPVLVIEQTPEGVYERTGVQVFSCLYDHSRDEMPNEVFFIKTVIVSGNDWYRPYYYIDMEAGDVDGDGRDEAILLAHSESNGIIYLCAFSSEKKKLVTEASGQYFIVEGDLKLSSHDGRVFLSNAEPIVTQGQSDFIYDEPKEYPLSVENGRVVIEGAENDPDIAEIPVE